MLSRHPLRAPTVFWTSAACVTAVAFAFTATCVGEAPEVRRVPDPRAGLSAAEARRIIGRVEPGRDLTPAAWPGGRRVAVALTFDLDAELVWMTAPDGTSTASLSRGRFGPRAGLRRVLDLLDRRGLPATFFLPALMIRLYPDAVREIQSSGRHEIGFHGYAHERVGSLSREQEEAVLRRGLELFRAAGLQPQVYRSPSWDFSPHTVELLAAHGFRLDSSLMADDRPYEILAAGRATGIAELPVDWSLDDWPYFQLEWGTPWPGLRAPDEVLEIWTAEFEGIRADGGLFTLTMHPQVIGRWSRLRMLERLVEHMDAAEDVWYATLGQAGEYLLGAAAESRVATAAGGTPSRRASSPEGGEEDEP